MPLYELLYSWKQKTVGPKDIKKMVEIMKKNQIQNVTLWRMASLTKLFTGVAKWQAYLMIYAGVLFIPPLVKQKYEDNPEKIYRLAVYCPIALGFILLPLIFYRRSSKRMLTSIDYNLPSNCLHLHTYRRQLLKVPISQISVQNNPKKSRILHSIDIKTDEKTPRTFQVEGYGEWQSIELFRHL